MNIRNIADLAGVSPATVSRVLNGQYKRDSSIYIQIRKIIDQNGYIRKKRVTPLGTILCVIPQQENISEHGHKLAAFLDEITGRSKMHLISVHSGKRERINEIISSQKISGIIYLSSEDLPLHPLIPAVVLNMNFFNTEYSSVDSDDLTGLCYLFAYLKQLGHKRIAYFSDHKLSTITQRARLNSDNLAFAYKYSNLEYDKDLIWDMPIDPTHNMEVFDMIAEKYMKLKKKPSALVLCRDIYAPFAYNAFLSKHVVIPDDLSVVGFDDESVCEAVFPHLTTVKKSLAMMAEAAFSILQEQIDNKINLVKRIKINPKLAIRESVKKKVYKKGGKNG